MNHSQLTSPPHDHDGSSVTGMMLTVCLALVPGLLCYILFFGWGILIQCLLAVVVALIVEWLVLTLRRRPVTLSLQDGSAIVTALLFAFTISPFTPWWIVMIGISFAIVFGKHVYGGMGNNPFNPAMTGYVFVLLCFPAQMNLWPAASGVAETVPGIAEYTRIIFLHSPGADLSADVTSGASPLIYMKSQLGLMTMVSEIRLNPVFGSLAGQGWEWVSLAFLFGGVAMLFTGVIKWRIPVAVLGGMVITSLVMNIYDSETYASPVFHLFAGGTMLAAFFVATDPVTAPVTPRGHLVYGVLIGVLAYSIRVWGSYPDGFAFAVLITNAAAPLISHYTRPRVLGEK